MDANPYDIGWWATTGGPLTSVPSALRGKVLPIVLYAGPPFPSLVPKIGLTILIVSFRRLFWQGID